MNVPPTNVRLWPEPMDGFNISMDAAFKVMARDDDGDSLHIDLDFGDASAHYVTDVSDTEDLLSLTVDHKYELPDDYVLTLNVSDGVNYTEVSLAVTVVKEKAPSILPLALGIAVAVIAVVAIAVMMMRRRKPGLRKEKEEEDVRLP